MHGAGGSAASNWDHLVERFAERHTVVRPNYAGSGQTTDTGGRLQLDDLVEQVIGSAVDAGQERFDLAGFSLGAVVAAGTGRQSELDLRIDISDLLSTVRARTLVIGCTRDQMVPVAPKVALSVAGSIKRKRFVKRGSRRRRRPARRPRSPSS